MIRAKLTISDDSVSFFYYYLSVIAELTVQCFDLAPDAQKRFRQPLLVEILLYPIISFFFFLFMQSMLSYSSIACFVFEPTAAGGQNE